MIKKQISHKAKLTVALLIIGSIVAGSGVFYFKAQSSSHREAPLITKDPKADATDLYAFVSPDRSDTVTLIANYIPFQNPAGGPNFYSFDDNVLYEIKVDSDGDAVEDVTYQFEFTTTVLNTDTHLYNTGTIDSLTDPDWNVQQKYTLTRVKDGQSSVIGENLLTPPSNIGPKSTPNYSALQAQAVTGLSNGTKVFAGQSNDPFFADLGGLFDLLNIRKLPGNAGGGINNVKGFNVNSLALQIPITDLTENGSKPASATDSSAVLGIWTTASRQSTRVLTTGDQSTSGPWVQISRLGHPLVNEVVIPLGNKDLFNGSQPVNDAQFADEVANPEVPILLNQIFGIKVPPQGPFGSPEQRDDLIAIFLTGIEGLTQPENVKPSELLRLNVGIPPSSSPSNLGVVGGDNAGFPNGRRLADDVIDIAIQVMAGVAYPLFHPDYEPDPLADQLGDGVDGREETFRGSFPYMALPIAGFDSLPLSTIGGDDDGDDGGGTPPPVNNEQPPAGTHFLYRLYNSSINDHFYTTSIAERDSAIRSGYISEGRLGTISTTEDSTHMPLYRLYSSRLNNHFYTNNSEEKDSAVRSGFRFEGVIGYVYKDHQAASGTDAVPVQRFFYPRDGDHFYTTNGGVRDSLVSRGYVYEGVAWFIKP